MNIGERTKITPQMFDDLLKFKEVQCGAKFVYLLDINDRLWCWGSNIDGQLLFDNYYKTQAGLLNKNMFQEITCGENFVLALHIEKQ